MNLPKLVPDGTPHLFRLIVRWFFIIFELIGLAFSLRALSVSVASFLIHFGYYVLLGGIGAVTLLYAWAGMTKLARKNTFQKVQQFYQERGFCREMPDAIKAIMPMPTKRDQVLRAYLLTRCEYYDEAKQIIADINETTLLRREYAMLYTTKLRLYMMTGRIEKFEHYFNGRRAELDEIYEMQRELYGVYTEYADDAFDYFMLSAAYLQMIGNQADAADYLKKAEFQLSNRSEADMGCYGKLLELNALYAAGKTVEAHDLEQALYVLPDSFDPPMTQPQKNMLRVAVEQARIFSAHPDIAAKAVLTERKLPPAGEASAASSVFAPM